MPWHASQLVQFMGTYGYPAMALVVLVGSAGLPLPISALLVALGALSVLPGGPNLGLVIAIGLAASVAGDLLDYGIGRVGLTRAVARVGPPHRERTHALTKRATAFLRHHLGLFIFLTRFMPTMTILSTPLSVVAGGSAMALFTFWWWDLAGETVFTLVNVLLGRFFGVALTTPNLLLPTLLVVAAAILLTALVLPRVRRRLLGADESAA
jgi:membrane protein DedA with SNARE-associated domain